MKMDICKSKVSLVGYISVILLPQKSWINFLLLLLEKTFRKKQYYVRL